MLPRPRCLPPCLLVESTSTIQSTPDHRDLLGNRAVENHGEFVAEMFTALLLGRVDELHSDGLLMELYERHGGAGIRHYDRDL